MLSPTCRYSPDEMKCEVYTFKCVVYTLNVRCTQIILDTSSKVTFEKCLSFETQNMKSFETFETYFAKVTLLPVQGGEDA